MSGNPPFFADPSVHELAPPAAPIPVIPPGDGVRRGGFSSRTPSGQVPAHFHHNQSTAMPNILLVEDNEMNRDMLSRRLERKGHSVAIAVDGQQGVDMALAGSYDLILMDMSLPVLDGWEATRRIKAVNRTVPIIALTAHAMEGDERKAREAGCDDYDTKPVDLARLLEKMDRLLKA